MPITGHPNARVHRLCRRCQQWHQPWEGHYEWPRVTGPMSWLRITIAKQVEDDAVMVWVCDACKTTLDARRQPLPIWLKSLLTLAMCGVIAAAAWLFKDELLSMLGMSSLGL